MMGWREVRIELKRGLVVDSYGRVPDPKKKRERTKRKLHFG